MPDQLYVDNQIYTFVKDFQSSYQVFASGLIRDTLTGEAPTGTISISLQPTNVAMTDQIMQAQLFIKVLSNGLFCLAGVPERIFPNLSTTDYTLSLVIQAPGYIDNTCLVSLPKKSIFPLPALSPVDMQRLPIRVLGRAIGMSATPTYIAGAQILLLDEPNPLTPLTEHVIALRTPLYFPHSASTTVQQRQLTLSGTGRTLTASVARGTRVLTLNDTTGLTANDVLFIGSEVAGEYVIIDNIPQNMPGQIHLFNTLNRGFAAETTIQQYVPGAIGTNTTLTGPAYAGDGVLFLQANLPATLANTIEVIEIADSTAALVEYHAQGAVTDANGYYRLDGITRVQTVYIEASATGFAAMQTPTTWTVDYGQTVNTVDFRLLPLANP